MGDKTKNLTELLKNAQELENLEKDIVEARISLANLNKDIVLAKKHKSEIDTDLASKKSEYVIEIDRLNKIISDLSGKQQILSGQNGAELANIENQKRALEGLKSNAKEQENSIAIRENNLSIQQKNFEGKLHILKQIGELIKEL